MSEIRRQKTPVSQLDVGMFVCELDRSWLGTPFLLEGLLIESHAEIATLKKLCQFVYIDHTLSVGDHYIAPAKAEKTSQEDKVSYQKPTPLNQTNNHRTLHGHRAHDNTPKFSFLEILKEIKASNQAQSALQQQAHQNVSEAAVKNVAKPVAKIAETTHQKKKGYLLPPTLSLT